MDMVQPYGHIRWANVHAYMVNIIHAKYMSYMSLNVCCVSLFFMFPRVDLGFFVFFLVFGVTCFVSLGFLHFPTNILN